MKRRYSKISLLGLLAAVTLVFLSRAPAQQKEPEVPYVSTPDEVVAEMLRIANVGKDDVVYDLGCGDGRIVITAAKMYGCRGVGIDINPERIRESRENGCGQNFSGN
jgi:predicted RNA methylase